MSGSSKYVAGLLLHIVCGLPLLRFCAPSASLSKLPPNYKALEQM